MEQTLVSGQNMTENTEQKKTVFDFFKEHKEEIIITGLGCLFVGVGIGMGVVIFKNRTAANALNIAEVVAKGMKTHGDAISLRSGAVGAYHAWNFPSNKPINVREHLRNLPDGWKPSQSKIDSAVRYGFSLGNHQTWVDTYAKTVA